MVEVKTNVAVKASKGRILTDEAVQAIIDAALAQQRAELEAKYAASLKPERVEIGPTMSRDQNYVKVDKPYIMLYGNHQPFGTTAKTLRMYGKAVFGTEQFVAEIEAALKAYNPDQVAADYKAKGYTVYRGDDGPKKGRKARQDNGKNPQEVRQD